LALVGLAYRKRWQVKQPQEGTNTPDSICVELQAWVAGWRWVESLQNADGGFPSFCRGWGTLPFDRSGADLTAHVMRTLGLSGSARTAPLPSTALIPYAAKAFSYLARQQRPD